MSSQEVTNLIVQIAGYMLILLGPMMLADTVFKKPGREIVAYSCYLISASVLLITAVYGFILFVSSNNPLIIGMTIFYGVGGLVWGGLQIYFIRQEILSRRKVRAETLF